MDVQIRHHGIDPVDGARQDHVELTRKVATPPALFNDVLRCDRLFVQDVMHLLSDTERVHYSHAGGDVKEAPPLQYALWGAIASIMPRTAIVKKVIVWRRHRSGASDWSLGDSCTGDLGSVPAFAAVDPWVASLWIGGGMEIAAVLCLGAAS